LCAGAVADRCQHRADECPPAKNPNATIGRTLRTSTKREGEQGHEGSGKAEDGRGSTTPETFPWINVLRTERARLQMSR
jgi:hypothetical protein